MICLELRIPGAPARRTSFERSFVTVGAGSRCDLVVSGADAPLMAGRFHFQGARLCFEPADGVEVARSGVGPEGVCEDGAALRFGAVEVVVISAEAECRLEATPLDPIVPLKGDEEPPLSEALGRFAMRVAFEERPQGFAAALVDYLRRAAGESGASWSLPDGDRDPWSSVLTWEAPHGCLALPKALSGNPEVARLLRHGIPVRAEFGERHRLFVPVGRKGLAAVVGLSTATLDERAADALRAATPLLERFAEAWPSVAARHAIEEENRHFRDRQRRRHLMKEIVANSAAMCALNDRIERLRSLSDPALLMGEAGTGKELIARILHHRGGRAAGMLITQHCGAMGDDELDFELFGHAGEPPSTSRRGVMELADGGTVFLDEVHRLSARLQTKLLRVLQEGEIFRTGESVARTIDVRIVASSHLDLMQLADEGGFRRDLALALSRHVLRVPPLRERVEDIEALTVAFTRGFARRYRTAAAGVSEETLAWLRGLGWPGNVRELQTVIERAVLHADPEQVLLERDDFALR